MRSGAVARGAAMHGILSEAARASKRQHAGAPGGENPTLGGSLGRALRRTIATDELPNWSTGAGAVDKGAAFVGRMPMVYAF